MPVAQRRAPRRLLSGLLRCILCGGPMTLQGQKYACARHRERGTCSNGKIIAAATIEARVLEGIKARLLAPAVIAEAVRAWHDQARANHAHLVNQRLPLERELEEIGRRIDRAADSFERGFFEVDELGRRILPLKARRAELRAALAAAAAPPPVRLHPRAADYYVQLVDDLAAALEGDDAAPARDLIRSAIERVDFAPRPGLGNFDLEAHGKLATLLGVSERAAAGSSNCEVRMGAGTGFEPVTFRL